MTKDIFVSFTTRLNIKINTNTPNIDELKEFIIGEALKQISNGQCVTKISDIDEVEFTDVTNLLK